MSVKVPDHIRRHFGGASKFRREKRRQLKLLAEALSELSAGCYYFPCGSGPVEKIRAGVAVLKSNLRRDVWGR